MEARGLTSQNLKYFVEIARDLNLTKTSARLFVSQQTLSGHIRRLEAYFGVPLFTRRKGLQLTGQGELLLREAKTILAAEERLFAAFRPAAKPDPLKLTIACHMARTQDYLPSAIIALSRRHPNVEVAFMDAERHDVDQLFAETRIDLSIGEEPGEFPGRKVLRLDSTPGCILIADSLLRRHLGPETDEFLARAVHGVELEDLPPEIPIVQNGIINGESWICGLLPELRFRPHADVVTADSKLQLKLHLDACRSGIAMLFVSEMYVNYLRDSLSADTLRSVHILPHTLNGQRIMREEFLAYDSSRPHPDYFFYFVDCVLAALRTGSSQPACGDA